MEAVNSEKGAGGAVAAGRPLTPGQSSGHPQATPGAKLTPREGDVLDMVRQALTNREIAGRLGLSEKTVKGHVTAVMRKLGAHNRVEAALIAERRHHFLPTGRR